MFVIIKNKVTETHANSVSVYAEPVCASQCLQHLLLPSPVTAISTLATSKPGPSQALLLPPYSPLPLNNSMLGACRLYLLNISSACLLFPPHQPPQLKPSLPFSQTIIRPSDWSGCLPLFFQIQSSHSCKFLLLKNRSVFFFCHFSKGNFLF